MAQSSVSITAGTGTPVDVFQTSGTGNNRQSIVIADPSTDAAAAKVNNTAPASSDYGLTIRQVGLPAAAALADDTANPTLTAFQAYPMVYDSLEGDWDRLPGDDSNGIWVQIKSAIGIQTPGAPVPAYAHYVGGIAKNSLPSAASDGQLAGLMTDRYGRLLALVSTIRDLVITQTTTISASTTETTILSAVPATWLDLIMLIISNTSASTNSRIDIRDTTGGSVLFSLQSNGGQPPIGFALPTPIPQHGQNTNWTAQCATSTTDIRVYAVAAKNK